MSTITAVDVALRIPSLPVTYDNRHISACKDCTLVKNTLFHMCFRLVVYFIILAEDQTSGQIFTSLGNFFSFNEQFTAHLLPFTFNFPGTPVNAPSRMCCLTWAQTIDL
jgi:hypothetical protein